MPAAQHIGWVPTASTYKSALYKARRRIKFNKAKFLVSKGIGQDS